MLYTTAELARAALSKAAQFSCGLAAHLRLVRAEIVPYPLAVEAPAVRLAHLRNEMETVLASCELEAEAEIVLAREMETAMRKALRPRSLVILASHRRLWRTREEELKRLCSRLGHEVSLSYIA